MGQYGTRGFAAIVYSCQVEVSRAHVRRIHVCHGARVRAADIMERQRKGRGETKREREIERERERERTGEKGRPKVKEVEK